MKTRVIQLVLASALLCLFSFSSYSQQRLILLEEYTGRGCGPCGRYNPAFDAMCNKNFPNKVVVIKYEEYSGKWTPPDLLPTDDGKARKRYYNFSSAPMFNMDGNYQSIIHIANLTQTMINTRYAMASPFNISLNYNYNAAIDSVFIDMTITATQTFSASGALYARIALTEKEIYYSVPMTPNGEEYFHHVFRKMLPDTLGYSLPGSWTTNQQLVINIKAKLPTNIFNLGELELVAFIQDDGTKEIKQAAYGAPKIFANDAGLDTIKNVPAFQCNLNAFTPSVTLKNNGSATLTAVDIKYSVDNGTPLIKNWTGSLAPGATEDVSLTSVTPTHGRHIIKAYTSQPNSAADKSVGNDTVIFKYSTFSTFKNTWFIEEFDQTTTNPYKIVATDFTYDDVDLDQITFQSFKNASYGSSFGVGEGTVLINYYRQINPNQFKIDRLYLPPLDITTTTAAAFIFDHAFAQYASTDSSVTLKVQVSSDCGNNWTTLFNQKSNLLATAPAYSSGFFIPTPTQWKSNMVPLSAYVGQSKVLIRLEVTSTGWENRLFLDKLGIVYNTGIESSGKEGDAELTIFPNPYSNTANLIIDVNNNQKVSVKIFNVLGELMYEKSELMQTGRNQLSVGSDDWTPGIYYVKMETGSDQITKKIVLKR